MRRSLLFVVLAVACVCVHQAHATCSIASKADNPQASEYVLSNAEKAAIVERHDWYKIHTPEAVDDMHLYQWDSALEATARIWAKKCFWGHSENSCRTNKANFSNIGENLASGSGSPYEPKASPSGMVKMIENWAGERAYYHWIGNSCDSGKVCGHYTQMVWHDSTHIGCSMMNCPAGTIFGQNPSWYLVCHYGKAGNWNGESPGHLAPLTNPCAQNRKASGASRCGEYGVCVMSGGNYHCECEAGYYSPGNTGECVVGNSTQEGCNPINGVDPCNGHGVCNADPFLGYRCTCSTGFSGDHCEIGEVDSCASNPCINGTCQNVNGTYACTCFTGYTGQQCDTRTSPPPAVPAKPVSPPPAVPAKPSSSPLPAPAKPSSPPPAAPAKPVSPPPPSSGPSKDDPFMVNLFDQINAERRSFGYKNVTWSSTLFSQAMSDANKCNQVNNNTLPVRQAEDVILICGYAGRLLPGSFAPDALNYWGDWYYPANIVSIGCGFTDGTTGCTVSGNPCGGLYKPVVCVYETSASKEADEAFKASPKLPKIIRFDQEQQQSRSVFTFAAIAAAGVVVAAAAVGLAVAARRRRAAAGQQVEYVELMVADQLA